MSELNLRLRQAKEYERQVMVQGWWYVWHGIDNPMPHSFRTFENACRYVKWASFNCRIHYGCDIKWYIRRA